MIVDRRLLPHLDWPLARRHDRHPQATTRALVLDEDRLGHRPEFDGVGKPVRVVATGEIIDSARHPDHGAARRLDVLAGSLGQSGPGQLEIRAHDGQWGPQLVQHFLEMLLARPVGLFDRPARPRKSGLHPSGH